MKESELKDLYVKYTPPIIKHVGDIAKQIGGHGGMDSYLLYGALSEWVTFSPPAEDVWIGWYAAANGFDG